MPQFTVSNSSEWELHPEGVFPATLIDWVPIESTYQGQTTERLQWKFETSETREVDGQPFQVSWFTSYKFGSPDQVGDKKSKLRSLCEALGVRVPETSEEAAAFDPGSLIGMQLRVKIVHKENAQGETRAIVFALQPLRPVRPVTADGRDKRSLAAAAAQGSPRPQPAPVQRARAGAAAPPPDDLDGDDPFSGDEAEQAA